MKNKEEKAQALSEALQNTDEGMLRQAYDTDNAEKFRLLKGKPVAFRREKERSVTNFRRYATAAACLAFAVCLALAVGSFAKNFHTIFPGPTDPTNPPLTSPSNTESTPPATTAPTEPTEPTIPQDTLPPGPYDPSQPPAVIVKCGQQSLAPMLGTYDWSYIVDEVGHNLKVDADNPLSAAMADQIPWLQVDSLVLPFQFQKHPDSIMVRCWEIGDQGNEAAYDEYQIASVADRAIQLKTGSYIYEITGEWYFDSDGYGKVTYVFGASTTAERPLPEMNITIFSGSQSISDPVACLEESRVYDDATGTWVSYYGSGGYDTLFYTDWSAADAYLPCLTLNGPLQYSLSTGGQIESFSVYFRSGEADFGLKLTGDSFDELSQLPTGQWYVLLKITWQGRYIEAQQTHETHHYDYLFLLDITENVTEHGICGENVRWSLNMNTGTLTISGTGAMSDIDHAPWYDYRDLITKVIIEEGVTYIGGFSHLHELTSVKIPSTVTTIADNGFSGCHKLSSIHLPEGITSIGSYAFNSCSSLQSIRLPQSLTVISWGMLSDCRSLASITLHEGITKIENYAFNNCAALTEITIPDSVISLGGGAFQNCAGLTRVTLGSRVEAITNHLFADCTGLTEIVLPESVTSIEGNAFGNCKSLKSIVISSQVSSIDYSAFSGCEQLKGFQIRSGSTYFSTDSTAIFDPDMTKVLLMAPGYMDCYQVPDGVTVIGKWAFADCALSGVELPNTVTTIEEYAFDNCRNMESAILSNQLKVIEMRAFMSCTALEEIVIPPSVEEIEYGAFSSCIGLKSVTFLGKMPVFGGSVFYKVTGYLYYPPYDEEWDHASQLPAPDMEWLPSICQGGHTVKILSGKPATCTEDGLTDGKECAVCGELLLYQQTITAIGHRLRYWEKVEGTDHLYRRSCQNCEYTEEKVFDPANIPPAEGNSWDGLSWKYVDGVLTISGEGFMRSYDAARPAPWYEYSAVIHTVNLPEGLQNISEYAFAGLINLRQITIPDAVTGIGVHAFDGCTSLRSVVIPDQVKNISNEAFARCTSLESVTVGKSVVNIRLDAFVGCCSLETVTFLGDMPYMEEAFRGLTFTACYPAGNPTWAPETVSFLDANITWIATP